MDRDLRAEAEELKKQQQWWTPYGLKFKVQHWFGLSLVVPTSASQEPNVPSEKVLAKRLCSRDSFDSEPSP